VIPTSYATTAAAIFVLGGLLACFSGYRLFRLVLGLYGFLLGAMLTTNVYGAGGDASTWTLVIAAIVGGLVGAVLMIAAYFIGVGLVGAGLSALALHLGWRLVGGDPPTVLLVIVCVVGALLALSVARYVVVFGTALAGAWTIIVGVAALMGEPAALAAASAKTVWVVYPLDPLPGRWWIVPAWAVLSLAGVAVQLATTTKTGTRKIKARAGPGR
jgi:hypothetical protein